MKSLLAILALASALGVGYWKMQNPDGGIDDAKSQAQSLMARLGQGVETVRSGGTVTGAATSATIPAQAAAETQALTTRLASLEESLQSDQDALLNRIEELEGQLQKQAESASGVTASSAPSGSDTTAVDQRLTTIDETLATAATLASDTETRMVQLEETIATMQNSPQQDSGGEELSDLRASVQEELATQNAMLSGKVSALEEQVTQALSAAEQNDDTSNRFALLETQLAAVKQNSESDTQQQLSSSRAAVESQLEGLRTRVKVLTADRSRQSAGEQKVVELDEKLATLTSRLNTLASGAGAAQSATTTDDGSAAPNTDALAAVTAQVDQRLAAIEERVSAATSADTRATIDALQTKLDEANARVAELDEKLTTNLGSSVNDLGGSVDAVTGEVAGITTNVSSLQSEVTDLKGGYTELQSSLSTLSGNVDTLKSTVESYAVEDLQNDLQAKLDNIETRIQSTSATDMESLNRTLDQSRERIESLEQRVTELPASSDESESARKAQSALQQQIAALEKRISNPQTNADPAIANTLSAVQQKVSALEQKRYVTAEDLQRSNQTRTIQYKIYFDKSQIEISDDAANVLDSFIAQESNRAISISIFGTTDRAGSSEYNEQLAKRRANRVRSYLIQRGYDFTKIGAVDGIGEDLAAAELPDGQEDPNLRSVIIYAYQP